MERLKKLALQTVDDLDKVSTVHVVMDNVKVDIRQSESNDKKFILRVTDTNDNLIFEYDSLFTKLEYDFIDITKLASDHNIGREAAAFLEYIIEAWYYGDIK